MKEYYVFSECHLDADERVMRVTNIDGEERRRLPVEEVGGIHLLAGYTITSGLINLAAEHNIPIHVYGYYGTYKGTFFPPAIEPTGSILISQLKSRLDERRRKEIAWAIENAANRNAERLLGAFDLDFRFKISECDTEDLLLVEARQRKEYYAHLDTVLPPFWSIVKRERRPPRRPADAVLGFVNSILYAKMAGWIYRAGLDPRISYLHGEKKASNPLALDLADIMKAPISEATLLELAATGVENSVVTKVGEGVYLNEKGRKTVIKIVEDIIKRTVKSDNIGRQDTVERWGMAVPRKLHRALVEEKEPDFPVIPCTLSSSTIQTLKRGRTYVPY